MFSSRKCQAAMEFLVLFAVTVVMFSGFMYFAHGQFERIEQTQIEIDVDALAEDLVRYSVFSLRTDYLKVRNFRLPVDVGGRSYSASLAQDVAETYVIFNLTDSGRLFYYPLKEKVSGKIDKSITLEHCITAKEGNASIAPSIIGLEPARIDEGSGWRDFNNSDFDEETILVAENSDFSFYIMGNCLHDFESLTANVIFVPGELSFEELKESGSHATITNVSCTPYGDAFFSSSSLAECESNVLGGTAQVEITNIGGEGDDIGPVGSDSLVEVVFNVQASSGTETNIVLSPLAFKDGLFRFELPPGDIANIRIT